MRGGVVFLFSWMLRLMMSRENFSLWNLAAVQVHSTADSDVRTSADVAHAVVFVRT